MALLTCSECGRGVSDQVEKCPECGYPASKIRSEDSTNRKQEDTHTIPQQKREVKPLRTFLMVIIVLFLLFAGWMAIATTNEKERLHNEANPQSASYKPTKEHAIQAAEEIILRMLKSPGSAKFQPHNEAIIYSLRDDPDVWHFMTYVDSQNSFGALIRMKYILEVRFNRQTRKWEEHRFLLLSSSS